ncbi:hypothetical protein ACTL6P_11945 [Endozoicomonas acroporae]|uniref:hypothetical protein n=1 Tax=Endozoicomonas acroporae TaxID=1701104 RepID=UPI0013D6BFEA|nr:hypothetical protein [Endozoicomonas acroporae]
MHSALFALKAQGALQREFKNFSSSDLKIGALVVRASVVGALVVEILVVEILVVEILVVEILVARVSVVTFREDNAVATGAAAPNRVKP